MYSRKNFLDHSVVFFSTLLISILIILLTDGCGAVRSEYLVSTAFVNGLPGSGEAVCDLADDCLAQAKKFCGGEFGVLSKKTFDKNYHNLEDTCWKTNEHISKCYKHLNVSTYKKTSMVFKCER